MGRSVPSSSQIFINGESSLLKFKYALRRQEQSIVDTLLIFARKHLSAVSYSGYAIPSFMFLFSILVEQQKVIQKLQSDIESLKVQNNGNTDTPKGLDS